MKKAPRRSRTLHPRRPPEEYAQLRTEVVSDYCAGLSFMEMEKKYKPRAVSLPDIKHILYAAEKRSRALVLQAFNKGQNSIQTMLIKESYFALMQGVKKAEWFPQAKIALGVMKGIGVFRSGQDLRLALTINQQIIEVYQQIENIPEQERVELVRKWREEHSIGADGTGRALPSAQVGPEENRTGSAVVGEELHTDL